MKAFFSYSWDSKEHKKWVRGLAERLRLDGVETILDKWVPLGEQLPHFMETSIRDSDFVLVVCTPAYKEKSDARRDGVGSEGNIITAELMENKNYLKFIPVLRSGTWKEAAPTALLGSKFSDLRDGPQYEENYAELLDTLLGRISGPPPVGKKKQLEFDMLKMLQVQEYIMGRAILKRGEGRIVYTNGVCMTENLIKEYCDEIKILTKNGGWESILPRSLIDEIIDGRVWKNGEKIYTYDEKERKEIFERCARSIQYRMEQYTGEGRVLLKFADGEAYFRYKE